MELLEAIKQDGLSDVFKKDPVPPELIEKMLEAARWRRLRLIVSRGIRRCHQPGNKAKNVTCFRDRAVLNEAPLVIVVAVDR